MKKVSLQMYSIRELMAKDVASTLMETAKAGYTGVEFAGFFDHTAEEIKSYLDAAGLVCSGTHTGLPALQPDTIGETIEYHHKIGASNLVVPGIPGEMYGSYDAACKTGALLNDIGAQLKAEGITLGYHNHHREFQVFNGQYALDLMYGNADPENLKVELDCYWAHVAGVDVVEYVRKYGKRNFLLHMKDRKPNDADKIAQGIYECTEVGSGVVDFKSVIALAKEFGTQWYVVEQESFDMPMLESIAKSAKWLNENT